MIKKVQLQVLPKEAANSDLLLEIVSEKVNAEKSSIKHIEILKRYGYYNYPSKGKAVFELTYDRFPLQRIKLYIDNSLIHFTFIDKEVVENWFIEDKDFLDLNFCEYYLSIHLIEKVPIKLIENHEFRLSPERCHKVIYGKDDEYF